MEWLAIIAGTIAALFIVFSRGKDAGENKKDAEALNNVAKAKKAADDVAAMPADERRERLRQYTKK